MEWGLCSQQFTYLQRTSWCQIFSQRFWSCRWADYCRRHPSHPDTPACHTRASTPVRRPPDTHHRWWVKEFTWDWQNSKSKVSMLNHMRRWQETISVSSNHCSGQVSGVWNRGLDPFRAEVWNLNFCFITSDSTLSLCHHGVVGVIRLL